jgi:ABC-type lipoprotein release transport system permease subunit
MLFKMAWRNIWRNRRRSVVTMAAMTLALWVMVLYSGLIEGYLRSMETTLLEQEMGDVQVFHADYEDEPSIYNRIDDPDGILAAADAAGLSASARLLGGGLAAVGDQSAGVSLRGVDVARDQQVSKVYASVADGQWLDPAQFEGVVIGRRLAHTLGAGPGDELIVLSQGADGSIANGLYTIRGVLRSVTDATDRSGVFLTEAAFRELLAFDEGAHQIIVRRPPEIPLDAAVSAMAAAAPGLDVRSWRERVPVLAQMLDQARQMISIIFFVIYLAVGILVLNATLMAVFERIRELGVMKALGAGPGRVLTLILTESVIMLVMSVVVGLGLALPFGLYLANTGLNMEFLSGVSAMGMAMPARWLGVYTADSVSAPISILAFMVLGASLIPALRAASIDPVRAMRHR